MSAKVMADFVTRVNGGGLAAGHFDTMPEQPPQLLSPT
jgi:hypothetical protein